MTSNGLSQEDIDRLLSGTGADAAEPAQPSPQQTEPDAVNGTADVASAPQDSADQSAPDAADDMPAEPEAADAPADLGGFGLGLGPSDSTGPARDAVGLGQPSSAFSTPQAPPTVRQVQFTQLPEPSRHAGASPIDLILDVNLEVTVELGRTSLPIAEILQLGPGAVVELDKLAGEPVDVLVNGKLVARAEVVVIDENFGVRITEITSPEDRIRQFA